MAITKAGRELREILNNIMVLHHPNHWIGFDQQHDISLLIRRAKRYTKMQENHCSFENCSGEEWDEREKRLEESIAELVENVPGIVGVQFSGDPRGYCVKLKLACGRSNNLGGEAWGIG